MNAHERVVPADAEFLLQYAEWVESSPPDHEEGKYEDEEILADMRNDAARLRALAARLPALLAAEARVAELEQDTTKEGGK